MGIRVDVTCKGDHIRDISVIQGKNSLTVNLIDWWDLLIGKTKLEFVAPGSEMTVGEYPNIFSNFISLNQPKNQFPLFDSEEVADFQDNVQHLKELGYTPPVLKGRHAREPNSFRIFNDGWKERT